MDGIAIQSNLNTARNSQLLGHSKGTNGPRKVLAEIQNVRPNKAVSFDTSCHKPAKKTTQVNRNITNTPSARTSKILSSKSNTKTPGIKSANHVKGAGNSIKIYEDTKHMLRKPVSQAKSNYDLPEYKEYMAPCTDKEFHIPLPDYMEKVAHLKPTFNIDYFSKDREIPPSDEFVAKVVAEYMKPPQNRSTTVKGTHVDDDIFLPMFSDLSLLDELSNDEHSVALLSGLQLLEEDEDLLLQTESDESFSLELLDKEIQLAGLEVPEW